MAGALDDIRDVRQRAAAILSGRKLQMLEDAGLAIIERRRLEALEQVAEYAKEIAYQSPDFFDPRWYQWSISREDMELLIEAAMKLDALDRGKTEHRVTVKNSHGETWELVFYAQPVNGYRAWATNGKSVWVKPETGYKWCRLEATERG